MNVQPHASAWFACPLPRVLLRGCPPHSHAVLVRAPPAPVICSFDEPLQVPWRPHAAPDATFWQQRPAQRSPLACGRGPRHYLHLPLACELYSPQGPASLAGVLVDQVHWQVVALWVQQVRLQAEQVPLLVPLLRMS